MEKSLVLVFMEKSLVLVFMSGAHEMGDWEFQWGWEVEKGF